MSPSPIPIKAWTPVMAANTVDSDAPPWPPMEYSITNANEEARTPRNPENIVAAMAPPVVLGNSLMRKRKASQPTRDVTIAMLRTFNPKTTTPAVGEEERLDHNHNRHDQCAHPGPQKDRGQGPTQQMPAGAGRYGEVEHLHCEDERGCQPGHRDLLFGQALAGLPERSPDPARGDGRSPDRRGEVHVPVWHVHPAQPPVSAARVNASDLQYRRNQELRTRLRGSFCTGQRWRNGRSRQ